MEILMDVELIDVIDYMKKELVHEDVDNIISMLSVILENDYTVSTLNFWYEAEEGVAIDFYEIINEAILYEDTTLINALLNFIESCGDVHEYIVEDLYIHERDILEDVYLLELEEDNSIVICDDCGEKALSFSSKNNGVIKTSKSCYMCGDNICSDCLDAHGIDYDNLSICHDCISDQELTREDIFRGAYFYRITPREFIDHVFYGRLVVYDTMDDLLCSNERIMKSIDEFVRKNISNPVNTGHEKLYRFILKDLDEVFKTSQNKIIVPC